MPTLLVIDDDDSILHFFRRAFPGPETLLVTAASAAEGLERMTSDRPDVVILDVDLPDQSGLEAFRRILSRSPADPRQGPQNLPGKARPEGQARRRHSNAFGSSPPRSR